MAEQQQERVALRVGWSTRADTREAVTEALRMARGPCTFPVLAIVFATVEHACELVASAMNGSAGDCPWVGAVTPAILLGNAILQRGIAIGVIDCDAARARVGIGGLLSTDPRAAGRRAALASLEDMPLPPADRSRAMILFSDTTCGDAAEALRGAVGVAGAGIAWAGGGMSGSDGGRGACLVAGGQPLRDHAVAITIDWPSRVGAGVQHGWQPTGAPAMVTRVSGVVVERLEHQPAFEVYRAAAMQSGDDVDAADFAAFATTHPLGIPQADGEYLIRDPLSVDERGAIQLVAGIPDGALVRLMRGTPDMLVEAARVAARTARVDAGGVLGGALAFDCVSRFTMLGDHLEAELGACHEALGDHVPLLGCLTYGEVGAFGARMPQFHNKTMVVLALPEPHGPRT